MEKNQTQPKKLQKLTKKQIGFVNDYVETGIASLAVKNNYNVQNDLTARVIGSENLTKPNVIQAIEVKRKSLKEALIERGITEDKIALKVDELLDSGDGNLIDKGLKHATNIYGIKYDEEGNKQNSTYNFIFNSETQKSVQEINEIIKAKLINNEDISEN